MKKYIVMIVIGIIVLSGIALFTQERINNGETKQEGRLQISASFYPLYYFASQIGGDKAQVYNVTPAGSEPHDYDPSTRDIARIEDGEMLILNGGVEAWGAKVKDTLKGTKVKVVIASEGLLTKDLAEDGQSIKDPHVWLNPQLAQQEAANITAGYISIDPVNASVYTTNQMNLNARLEQLDQKYKDGLRSCKSKNIVTSHAAFAYLAQQYGLNQIAISGLSPDEEPTAAQLIAVAKFAKENSVRYIFFESLVSPKLSETIASEIGAKTLTLDPLEGISDDGIKQGKNYFTVMEENLKNLQEALQCTI